MPYCYRCPDLPNGKVRYLGSEWIWVLHTIDRHGWRESLPWWMHTYVDWRFRLSKGFRHR
jgi:hypothetical protein